jgi:thioredoxin-dependent peroxiredoxin
MSTKLSVGDTSPLFESLTYQNRRIVLKDLIGKHIIALYFYPRDNTPGCTKEACSIRDRINELTSHGIKVLGVSTDSVHSHEKFRDKFGLNFELISDKSKEIVKLYGVENMFGTASRKTFLIDRKGIIRFIWNKVKTSVHADEIIDKVKELNL